MCKLALHCFFVKPVSPDALFGTVLQAILKMALSYCSSYEHDIFPRIAHGHEFKNLMLESNPEKRRVFTTTN